MRLYTTTAMLSLALSWSGCGLEDVEDVTELGNGGKADAVGSPEFSLMPDETKVFSVTCNDPCDILGTVHLVATGVEPRIYVALQNEVQYDAGLNPTDLDCISFDYAFEDDTSLSVLDYELPAGKYYLTVGHSDAGQEDVAAVVAVEALFGPSPYLCYGYRLTGNRCNDNSEGFFPECWGECREQDVDGVGYCYERTVVVCD